MKRLRLIGFSEQKDQLLQDLLHLGCVEITEPGDKAADPDWTQLVHRDSSSFAERKAEAAALSSAMTTLKKYAPKKKGLFRKRVALSSTDFFDDSVKAQAMDIANTVNDCTREISRIYSAENKLNASLSSLLPWADLSLPLEQQSTAQTELVLGTAPPGTNLSVLEDAMSKVTDLAQLTQISGDAEQNYYLLIVHKSVHDEVISALRPLSFGVVRFKGLTGTAQENIDRLRKEKDALESQRKEQEECIAANGGHMALLERTSDRVNQELNREAVSERFLTDGRIFFAEGWLPADRVEDLTILLNNYVCAWESADPAEGETPPTLLKNPKWMECINMVTEMYSLPAYDGIDPNPLYFFWYVFFFGFMFADVAYGLIILTICILVTKFVKPKKTLGRMFQLGIWLGASTAICGIFMGGFFGNALEVIYQTFIPGGLAVMPAWMVKFCSGIVVNPISDPMSALVLSIAIGCVHLIMGQCIHIYMGFRDGVKAGLDSMLDVVPWWVLFAGIGVFAVKGTAIGLLIGVLTLIATQGRHAKGFGKKLFGGIKSLYDVTSWLSDVLSYARLMALMLATSVIAQVFNTIGALPGSIIAFVLVFVVGHGFNIGINLIGTYVHAARLQYLEYFSKFYKEGGIPFRPLQYDTKYVDIKSEEDN